MNPIVINYKEDQSIHLRIIIKQLLENAKKKLEQMLKLKEFYELNLINNLPIIKD